MKAFKLIGLPSLMIGARISKGHPIAPGLPAVCEFLFESVNNCGWL